MRPVPLYNQEIHIANHKTEQLMHIHLLLYDAKLTSRKSVYLCKLKIQNDRKSISENL